MLFTSSKAAAMADTNDNVQASETYKNLTLSWSRTICYHCRRETQACDRRCEVATSVPSRSVVHHRTLAIRCSELQCKHNSNTNI